MLQDLRGLLAHRCALRCPWTLRMFCALGVSGEQQLPGGGRRTGHGWTALWKLHQRFLGEVAFLGWGKIDVGIDVDILDVGRDLKCDFDLEDLEKVGVLAVYCIF